MSEQTSVEARLQRLEDIEQITRLLHSYRMLLDTKQFEAVSQLFSEDAKFITVANNEVVFEVEGRSDVQVLFEGMAGRNGRVHTGDDLHHFVDPVIELDGDTATVNVVWTLFVKNENGTPQLLMCGRHEDICIRTEIGWKIHEIRAFIDMHPEASGR